MTRQRARADVLLKPDAHMRAALVCRSCGRPPDARRDQVSGGATAYVCSRCLVERVVISTPLDPFLSLRALAGYSGLGVRKLRDYLDDPAHPLACYRVGGKILVRRSEFDAWMARYRQVGRPEVERIVSDVLRDLSPY